MARGHKCSAWGCDRPANRGDTTSTRDIWLALISLGKEPWLAQMSNLQVAVQIGLQILVQTRLHVQTMQEKKNLSKRRLVSSV